MTTHDEKILQLLDRIHATAQNRREQTIDGAVQAMERVNRTSYGALRELTENGHKKKGPVARAWQAQELLVDDDGLVSSVPAEPAAAPPTAVAATVAVVPGIADAAASTEITQVMGLSSKNAEPTAVTAVPTLIAGFEPTHVAIPTQTPAPARRAERPSEPDEIVSGDGATYHGTGSSFQQTQVIWFRRLFRRR